MRPRVFPAEDSKEELHRGKIHNASMRPRVFPAEDFRHGCFRGDAFPCFNEAAGIPRGRLYLIETEKGRYLASMRPRVFPAEDLGVAGSDSLKRRLASMRPRVFPAEDDSEQPRIGVQYVGFNEAAGIPRGRPIPPRPPRLHVPGASMRPRVFPAEDASAAQDTHRQRAGFNEAAGIPRGRRGRMPMPGCLAVASMRPRVFPAEDVKHGSMYLQRVSGFNEAAGIPRGRLHLEHGGTPFDPGLQ